MILTPLPSLFASFAWFGEVLLTTRLGQVFLRLSQAVLTGYTALRERHAKCELIETRPARAHAKCQPAVRVETTGKFDLHEPFALASLQGQAGKGLFIQ